MFWFLVLCAVVILLLVFCKKRLDQQKKAANIHGWVKDQDLDGRGSQVYMNRAIGISCKPDVTQKRRVKEYKSSSCYGNKPFPSDLVQLAAQMMATGLEEGELEYANKKTFVYTQNDPEIKYAMSMVMQAVQEMRESLATRTEPKATPTAKKCAACDLKYECTYSPIHGNC